MNDPPPGCSAGPVSDKDCNYSFILLTLCLLMDFPMHMDTISMELPIVYFKGHR